MIKKWLIGLMVLFIGILGCNGCGPAVTKINVVGSTSVQPIAEFLAEEFMRRERGIKIMVQGGGSSAGIKAIQDGTAAIGTSSRVLTPEENKLGLKPTTIAWDGIAIIVNPANRVNRLSVEQLARIYSGAITNWSRVGGVKENITLVNREAGSGTREAFTKKALLKRKPTANSIVQASTGAVRQTVAGDPNAIGYISVAAVDRTVKKLLLEGIECTPSTIKAETYPIVRPFLFVTKGKTSAAVQKFLTYVLTKGQRLVGANGFVTINS